jgi:hypothetical protein
LANKVLTLVRTIAEGFVLGMPATAKTHGGPSTKAEFLAFLIHDFKITFDAKWTIVKYRHFGSSHEFPPVPN